MLKSIAMRLPAPVKVGGDYRFLLSEIRHERERIVALSRGEPEPEYIRPDDDCLMPLSFLANTFNISISTVRRRIKEYAAERAAVAKAAA
jgi:hypothetical protein